MKKFPHEIYLYCHDIVLRLQRTNNSFFLHELEVAQPFDDPFGSLCENLFTKFLYHGMTNNISHYSSNVYFYGIFHAHS
jgi:hypothetical protein